MLADALLAIIAILLVVMIRDLRLIRAQFAGEQYPCFSQEVLKTREQMCESALKQVELASWTEQQWAASSKREQAGLAAKKYLANVGLKHSTHLLKFMKQANFDVRVGRRSPEEVKREQNDREFKSTIDPIKIMRHEEALRRAILNDEPIPEPPQLAWD